MLYSSQQDYKGDLRVRMLRGCAELGQLSHKGLSIGSLGFSTSLGVSSSVLNISCIGGLPHLGSDSVGNKFPISFGVVLNGLQPKSIFSDQILQTALCSSVNKCSSFKNKSAIK